MTILPPETTLFPYTTLFRSGIEDHRNVGVLRPKFSHIGISARSQVGGQPGYAGHLSGFRNRLRCRVQRDRKSTRLNSSHVSISYAVFCLKIRTILARLLFVL